MAVESKQTEGVGTGVGASGGAAPQGRGALAAIGAYGSWGLFPLLFRQLDAVNPVAVVANRVVWSFILVGAILTSRGRLGEVRAALSTPATLRGIALSAILLAINWLVFVWGVHADRVIEVSFGYFINPLVSIAIGMVLLGERMNRLQWIAIFVATVAVAVQGLGLSGLPVVSLTLAFSFGFYGYIRKMVPVGSAIGLFIETLVLLPVAVAYLAFTMVGQGLGPYADPWLAFWLVMTGPATSVALILFAYGARRLPLSAIGMFQYIAPSMHFLLAVYAFGEPLNGTQLFSFGLIWLSLGIYSWDSFKRRPRSKRAAKPLKPAV